MRVRLTVTGRSLRTSGLCTIPRVQIRRLVIHGHGPGSRIGARAAVALSLVLALAGCGLGSSPGSSAVGLTITRDFGAAKLGSAKLSHVGGSETLLGLLERSFPVRMVGNTVATIAGVSATPGTHWFQFVNGSATSIGTPKLRTAVHAGDQVWWDLQADTAAKTVPAVVGSFPEPFIHGVGGKRLPVTLECALDTPTGCTRAADALTAVGIPAARQLPGTGSGTETLSVILGTWHDLRREIVGYLIAAGPAHSGVYARFGGSEDGTLELLDAKGRVVRSLGPGAGLVAAIGNSSTQPAWLITGTDPAGVSAAASALEAGRLRDHLAMAVQGSVDLPLPQP